MADVEQKVLDAIGRAMGRFSMLRPGDRVAVGVSGGKDSLTLLHALAALARPDGGLMAQASAEAPGG